MSYRRDLYAPHGDANPLVSIAFGMLFKREFREVDIKSFVEKVNSNLTKVVPGRKFIKGQTFEISNGVPKALDSEQVSGVEYSKFSEAGESVVTFKVNGSEAIVTLSSYKSWGESWSIVSPIFDLAFKELLQLNNPKALISQYQDLYKMNPNSTEWKNRLFREKSKYVPSFVYECDELWHNHSGWYSQLDNKKLLTQLFINLLEQKDDETTEPYKVLDIKFNHVLHFSESDVDKSESWISIFRKVHDYNKSIFSNMLSDGECEAIGL